MDCEENPTTRLLITGFALAVSLIVAIGVLSSQLRFFQDLIPLSRTDESFLGLWARRVRRSYKWSSLRVDVEVEVPVIYMTEPQSLLERLFETDSWHIDGGLESFQRSNIEDDSKALSTRERASWLELIHSLHRMEESSSSWQNRQYEDQVTPQQISGRTSIIAVQAIRRSVNPQQAKGPLAITMLDDLAEIAASLGMHWSVFD
jgi:hypothetical protein